MNESTINQMIILFAYMVIGFACNKIHLLNKSVCSYLSKFILCIPIPAMAIHSAVAREASDNHLILQMVLVAVLIYAVTPVISFFICKIFKMDSTYRLMLNYSNIGYMGIPIVESFLGPGYVFYEVIMMTICNISIFSLGVITLTGVRGGFKTTLKKLCTPTVIASVIGFAFALGNIKLPEVPTALLGNLGGMTTPIAMIIVGAQLGEAHILDSFTTPKLYLMTLFRLIVYPIITYGILYVAIGFGPVTQIATIAVAMPVAGLVTMLCYEYGGDYATATHGTCLSTIISIFSIPFLLSFFPPL